MLILGWEVSTIQQELSHHGMLRFHSIMFAQYTLHYSNFLIARYSHWRHWSVTILKKKTMVEKWLTNFGFKHVNIDHITALLKQPFVSLWTIGHVLSMDRLQAPIFVILFHRRNSEYITPVSRTNVTHLKWKLSTHTHFLDSEFNILQRIVTPVSQFNSTTDTSILLDFYNYLIEAMPI